MMKLVIIVNSFYKYLETRKSKVIFISELSTTSPSLARFGDPRPLRERVVATPIFPSKVAQKWKISVRTQISYHQSIDNSLLSSH